MWLDCRRSHKGPEGVSLYLLAYKHLWRFGLEMVAFVVVLMFHAPARFGTHFTLFRSPPVHGWRVAWWLKHWQRRQLRKHG